MKGDDHNEFLGFSVRFGDDNRKDVYVLDVVDRSTGNFNDFAILTKERCYVKITCGISFLDLYLLKGGLKMFVEMPVTIKEARKGLLPCPECWDFNMEYDKSRDVFECPCCHSLFDVDDLLEGEWERRREEQLEWEENMRLRRKLENDEWDEAFEDCDEQPEGCKACGNPAWPNCESSCPMFDD